MSGKGFRQVSAADAARVWGDNPGFRLFLSHRAEERAQTAQIKGRLEKFGVSAFVAHNDIHPTHEWQTEIENALATMDALAALITPDFFTSVWTNQEIGFAVARGVPIVPVRMPNVPTGFIGRIQALSSDWDHADVGIAGILIRNGGLIDAYISALNACTSFDRGNELAVVLPEITALTPEQVNGFTAAYNNNFEIRGSFGFNGGRPADYGQGLAHHLQRVTGRAFALTDDNRFGDIDLAAQ